MGPIIMLDKSALQSLSPDELLMLGKHYIVNIAPICPVEIIADLKKPTKKSISTKEVQILSQKLRQTGQMLVNVHYAPLVVASLFGLDYSTKRRPILPPMREVHTKDGRRGLIRNPSKEEEAITRWAQGEFSEAEQLLAERWRESTKSSTVELVHRKIADQLKSRPRLDTAQKLASYLDYFLTTRIPQDNLFQLVLNLVPTDDPISKSIRSRWNTRVHKTLYDFAPYATYFLRVSIGFYLALASNIIGTKATNSIDLEYFFYTPFCQIFCSNDGFHSTLTSVFLYDDQIFVKGKDLKNDLGHLAKQWNTLSQQEQREHHQKYHSQPTDNQSLTYRLWQQLFPEWEPHPSSLTSISEEEKQNLCDEIKQLGVSPNVFPRTIKDSDQADFVIIESYVGKDDACPCGSGKRFVDCCWDKVNQPGS